MALDKVSKLYEIVWSDPAGNEMNIDNLRNIIKNPETRLNEFLVKTSCFGEILHQDKDSILLEYYLDGKGLTKFKTIPKTLVTEVIHYSRNDKINLKDYWRNERKTKRRRLVEVDWLAPNNKTMSVDELTEAQYDLPEDLLVSTLSYGVVATENPDTLILKHYENDMREREVQIIPQDLIKKVTPFYSKRK